MRLSLFLLALTGGVSLAQPPAPPLPDGAVRRFGTTDFRPGGAASMAGFAVSPDGKSVATVTGLFVQTWDLASGRSTSSYQFPPFSARPSDAEVRLIPTDSLHTDRRVTWAPDGQSLLIPRWGVVYRLSVPLKDEPTKLPTINARTGISAITFAKQGGELFAVSNNGELYEFRPKTQEWVAAADLPMILRDPRDPKRSYGHYQLAAGKGIVALAGEDGFLRMWDSDRRRPLESIELPTGASALTISADGKWLAVQYSSAVVPAKKGDDIISVELWNLSERKRVRQWPLAMVRGPLALSADGSRLAFVRFSEGKTVEVHDTATGKLVHALPGNGSETLKHLAFAPDGSRLLAAGSNGAIHRWDLTTGKPVDAADGHRGVITLTVALKDGQTLTGGTDGAVILWDEAGKEVRRFVGHTETVTGVALSPDGKTLYTSAAGQDKTVRAWSFADGKELRLTHSAGFKVPDDRGTEMLALSPDGKTLVAGFMDHLRLLAADDFKEIARLRVPPTPAPADPLAVRPRDENQTLAARFLADGRLVTFNTARTVRLWDLEKKAAIQAIPIGVREYTRGRVEHADANSFALSPDGKTVAVPTYPREFDRNRLVFVGFWELEGGKQVARAELPHGTHLSAVAYTPDGKSVIVGDEQKGRIWQVDVESKKVTRTFDSGRHFPRSLAVFPDGKGFVSGGTDTTALIWKLDPK